MILVLLRPSGSPKHGCGTTQAQTEGWPEGYRDLESFDPWEWNLKSGVRHPQPSQGKTM